MKASMKKTLVSSAVTGALMIGAAGFSTAKAELEFNAGVFSDYILWGTSASDSNAVVQGGVDYGHESGFYLGTWISTLGDSSSAIPGQEVDLYAGYGFGYGDVEFDVSYVYYYYPAIDDADYGDIIGTVSYGPVYFTAQYALNAENSDFEGSTVFKFGGDTEIMPSISLGAEIGTVNLEPDDTDWVFWSLGVTKSTDMGDISLTYAPDR
jgi:uncharacterized protein (TIGR02001 family)